MYFGSTTVIAYSLLFWVLRLIASNAVISVYSLLQNFCKENLSHKMRLLSVYEL
ncbi:hypothetical protein MC7420_2867 [Coleofasciculus chthonoplastes PCC 7420]|uniref:Uncharacterized protein n=1 Tax=Coleofasciculus chthonoplastes PCC 7420 TaxID=118168 RepID=B4VJY3_9CYAN|nr:hypothetical protein MC7420_2867 [Coleofasciculus chthonoplastes PCC 7420]